MNNQSYSNLMCFGRDISNCPITETCPDYKKCKEKYDEDWLVLFNEEDKMKIVVNSIPDSSCDCLFLKDYYKETCKFDGAICVFSSWFDSVKEEYKKCPYLIELKELSR